MITLPPQAQTPTVVGGAGPLTLSVPAPRGRAAAPPSDRGWPLALGGLSAIVGLAQFVNRRRRTRRHVMTPSLL